MQHRGFKELREEELCLWVKVCPKGCPNRQLRLSPDEWDEQTLRLKLDDVIVGDCEHPSSNFPDPGPGP